MIHLRFVSLKLPPSLDITVEKIRDVPRANNLKLDVFKVLDNNGVKPNNIQQIFSHAASCTGSKSETLLD